MLDKEIKALEPAPRTAIQRIDVDAETDTRLAEMFDAGLRAFAHDDWRRARALMTEVVVIRPEYARHGFEAAELLADSEWKLGRSALRGGIFIVLSVTVLLGLTFFLSSLSLG